MNLKIIALLHEVFELESGGMITSGGVGFGRTDIAPGKIHLEGQGEILYKLMQLSTIDRKQLDELAEVLS